MVLFFEMSFPFKVITRAKWLFLLCVFFVFLPLIFTILVVSSVNFIAFYLESPLSFVWMYIYICVCAWFLGYKFQVKQQNVGNNIQTMYGTMYVVK